MTRRVRRPIQAGDWDHTVSLAKSARTSRPGPLAQKWPGRYAVRDLDRADDEDFALMAASAAAGHGIVPCRGRRFRSFYRSKIAAL